MRDGRSADHAPAAGRPDHPHRLDGGPLYRRLPGAALYRGKARHRGDEPLDQHAGMQERHPFLRLSARRGRDGDPRQAPQPGQPRGARPHGAAAGLRRSDPLPRAIAAAPGDERGYAEPDLEPALRRGDRETFVAVITNPWLSLRGALAMIAYIEQRRIGWPRRRRP